MLCMGVQQGKAPREHPTVENTILSHSRSKHPAFTYSFTQQILSETLLCAKHCSGIRWLLIYKVNETSIVPGKMSKPVDKNYTVAKSLERNKQQEVETENNQIGEQQTLSRGLERPLHGAL